MKLTEEQIKYIAEQLDSGCDCHYNTKTNKILTLPTEENMMYADEDEWEKEIREVEENQDDIITFEVPASFEAFRIMEGFIDTVDDDVLRGRLLSAINRRRPFQNFKREIENSGKYRQLWFAYKSDWYQKYVRNQIDVGFSTEG